MSTRNLLLILVPLVVVAALLLTIQEQYQKPAQNSAPSGSSNQQAPMPPRITVEGMFTCLPHRDTTGPHTMECAFGVREDGSGNHYSIDPLLMASMSWQEISIGSRIRVEGIITPIEMLSSDHWQKYDVVGIISATSIVEI